MRLFLFLVGLISISSPVIAYHLDGGKSGDDAGWYHWLMTKTFEQHLVMQGLVFAGVFMVAAACGVRL